MYESLERAFPILEFHAEDELPYMPSYYACIMNETGVFLDG
jgi:hypothetical protein